MPENAVVVDPTSPEVVELALSALREITPEPSIGEPVGVREEADGVVSLLFSTRLEGYPGWFWTVSIACVTGSAPTVLEAELLPGEGALVAPEWVPWAVRLAEYKQQQAALAAAGVTADDDAALDEDVDDDIDDGFDDDELDDSDGVPVLHGGDLDGVDIDELDESLRDDESPEELSEDEFDG